MHKFRDLRRSLGRNLAVLAVLAMATTFAHADLIGDDVTGAIVGGPGAFQVVPPNATVGDGIEFFIEFVGTPSHSVDIGAVSMSVANVFGARISTGAGEVLVLGDLDSSVPGEWIGGITNFQTNEEYTIDDVTFTDHEVRFAMSPNIWEIDGFASWDLVFVPEPSALALMGVAGLVGLGRRR